MFDFCFGHKLRSILWKNWLVKSSHFAGLLSEILLPVFFMSLLVLLKTISEKYDSPNVAYYCGNTYPWFYSDSLFDINNFQNFSSYDIKHQIPVVCTQKPSECSASNYYQDEINYLSIEGYSQYGYIQSSASSFLSSNPFYSYTIADTARVYEVLDIANPSLPFCDILRRITIDKAILAIAPCDNNNNNNQELTIQSKLLRSYMINQCIVQTNKTVNNHTISHNYSSTIRFFNSQTEVEDYITNDNYDDDGYGFGKVAFAIVFNNVNKSSQVWDYSIRVNYTGYVDQKFPTVGCLYNVLDDCKFTYTIPSTKYYTANLRIPQSAEYLYGYTYSGFATLQQIVDKYIFSLYRKSNTKNDISNYKDSKYDKNNKNTGNDVNIMASVSLMPTSPYFTDSFQDIIANVLGIFYMLSFLYPVSRFIKVLVVEKETKIKEVMKIMGLSDFLFNISWWVTSVIQMTIIVIIITLVTSNTLFKYSNKVYVFIFFEMFSLSVISLCFLLSSFFSKSKTATLLGPMIFFISFFPYYAVNNDQFSTTTKAAMCLLAPACFALGADVIMDYEGGLEGIQSYNINISTSNFTYLLCIGMLILDTFLYGLLYVYLEKVIPSDYGTQLPFYYPLLPSYWLGNRFTFNNMKVFFVNKLFRYTYRYNQLPTNDYNSPPNYDESLIYFESTENPLRSGEEGTISILDIDDINASHIEELTPDLKQQLQDGDDITSLKCLSIRRLRKEFGRTITDDQNIRVAVSCLNLDLFRDQVTVLLGHNGAGKTTVINMLVGLTSPTSGNTIFPGGLNIVNDMRAIRTMVGVCPQHDVLFLELTVIQHLNIYASFKGVPSNKVSGEVKRMINEVGLTEKANAKACTLSGGQKRKLSLAIALIGDSAVVILDECTSGMDPYSRRATWNIIQNNKKGRVILLTTHFMDEADLLADRVAILMNGQLQCVGSPLFLKKLYSVGYTLTAVKESQVQPQKDVHIENSIKSFVPTAEVVSNIGSEISFRLPFESCHNFVEMLSHLDNNKQLLGINEYGVSVTTLEEVFIRVGENKNKDNVNLNLEEEISLKSDQKVHDILVDDDKSYKVVKETFLFFTHFRALVTKRALYARRDKKFLICQVILPLVVVIIGLSLLLLKPDFNQPDLVLSPAKYNTDFNSMQQNYIPFSCEPSNVSNVAELMMDRFKGYTDDGVWGVAVPISSSDVDNFLSCAVGASELNKMSQFLLNTQSNINEGGSSRYGAITVSNMSDLNNLYYNVMVNGSSYHGVGIFINEVHQAFLQVLTNNSNAKITVHNYPLPQTYKQETEQANISAFIVALFSMIAFCFIPVSFVLFIVREKEVKAKHQQIISGVGINAYWISTLFWDILSYIPTAMLVYSSFYMYGIDNYTKGSSVTATLSLFLLFGPAAASQTYLLSFLFNSHSSAQVFVMFFNFFTGLCFVVVSFVLTLIPSATSQNISLRYFFRLFPAFCLGDGLLQLAVCSGEQCPVIDSQGYNVFDMQPPLGWDITLQNITFMTVEMVVYFLLAITIENALTFSFMTSFLYHVDDPGYLLESEEDIDVSEERRRVMSGSADTDIICLKELRKVYPLNSRSGGINCPNLIEPLLRFIRNLFGVKRNDERVRSSYNVKVAVESLCFGIPKGECFGFLGINGAGKSSVLSILSGEFQATKGDALIDGYSIKNSQTKIRKKIGYCPQFDALLEFLTVREHIELFARIKGLTGIKLKKEVEKKIDQLDLRDFHNKIAGSLSGGNKRKLSVAVATIGMDPVSRRFMWDVIAKMCKADSQCSVILTTHGMDEAEALCNRIGIMVNGKLSCFGSPQHLKHRFGNGFEVNIRTKIAVKAEIINIFDKLKSRIDMFATESRFKDFILHKSTTEIFADNWKYELNFIYFTLTDISTIALILGNSYRLQQLEDDNDCNNNIIKNTIKLENNISSLLFMEWWLAEDTADKISKFMSTEFPNNSYLLERSSLYTLRYRISFNKDVISENISSTRILSDLFNKFEKEKNELNIEEYSVGQTTLEQIFNQFAALQDNISNL